MTDEPKSAPVAFPAIEALFLRMNNYFKTTLRRRLVRSQPSYPVGSDFRYNLVQDRFDDIHPRYGKFFIAIIKNTPPQEAISRYLFKPFDSL